MLGRKQGWLEGGKVNGEGRRDVRQRGEQEGVMLGRREGGRERGCMGRGGRLRWVRGIPSCACQTLQTGPCEPLRLSVLFYSSSLSSSLYITGGSSSKFLVKWAAALILASDAAEFMVKLRKESREAARGRLEVARKRDSPQLPRCASSTQKRRRILVH